MKTMHFTGFSALDFDTFLIDGLDGRMTAIRERIQPKFQALGDSLCSDVALMSGMEMFLHIARHARRKVNPPVDTWLAIGPNKRGYKQHPHFQVGLFDDRLFVWLALIYELPDKQAIAGRYLQELDRVRSAVPADFVLSFDHMKKDATAAGSLNEESWKAALTRFRDVKSVELLIGRNLDARDPVLSRPDELEALIRGTFETLMPLYLLAMDAKQVKI